MQHLWNIHKMYSWHEGVPLTVQEALLAAGAVSVLAGVVSSSPASPLRALAVRALANAALDDGKACLAVMPLRLVAQLCEDAEACVRVRCNFYQRFKTCRQVVHRAHWWYSCKLEQLRRGNGNRNIGALEKGGRMESTLAGMLQP